MAHTELASTQPQFASESDLNGDCESLATPQSRSNFAGKSPTRVATCAPNAAILAARFWGISQVKRYTSSVAVAALILAGSVAALAQDAAQGQAVPAGAKAAAAEEEIVITGSRIKRQDLVAESPLALIGADEIAATATVNAEDVIRELPQALPGISPGVNNGNPGAATVNLRALDDERTLVLVDGKRFVGYDSEGIVDINNIPTALIERVDVVTGGASAVYGSDAIAGVVNFVLKDDFEGVQFDYNYVNALRGGESTNNFSATFGMNAPDERGNLVFNATWTDRDAVSQGARVFSERSITTADGSFGGSSTDTNGNILCGGCEFSGAGPNFGPQNFVGFESANGDLIPRGARRFNFNPFNLLQVPQERYQGTALGHYDINEYVTLYGFFTFAQTDVDTIIAPSGTFFSEFDIPFDSIYLTPQAQSVLFGDFTGTGNYDIAFDTDGSGTVGAGDVARYAVGRRTIEVGPRITRNRTQGWQLVGGFKGEIPFLEGWSYDVSGQRGRTELTRVFQNDINGNRVQDILDGSSPTLNPGAVDGGACAPGTASTCVVGSLFGDGSLNAGAADYISLSLNEDVFTTQDVFHFDVAGELGEAFKVPGASPIGASFGAEYRRVRTESFPDDCYSTPDCSIGFGSTTPVIGKFNVKEVFGELRVPLIEGRRFAESASFGAAYRWADYSHTGTATAWKLSGEYKPIEDLLLRVNYQRAVRAPNVFEFAQPFTPGLDNANGDPCAAFNEATGLTTVDQFTRDLCVATGVDPTLFTPTATPGVFTTGVPDVIAGQINAFSGGNSNLKEEKARTLTVGGVFQPSFLEGLNIAIDWYRVRIKDPISSLDANVILSGCYDPSQNPTADPNSLLCSLVLRNPSTGGLIGNPNFGLNEAEINIGKLVSEGVDIGVDYALDLGNFGNVDIQFTATKVIKINDKPTDVSPTNVCKGKFGPVCDSPNPSLRFTQRTTMHTGDFSFGYRWRYIRSTRFEQPELDVNGDGVIEATLILPEFERINDVHYVDFLVEWAPTNIDMLDGFSFQVGLENAFDEDAPIVGSEAGTTTQNSGNTFPGSFDTVGRALTLRASKKF